MPGPGRAGNWVAVALASGAAVGAGSAQNSWFFEVEYSDPAGVINSLDDTVTVTLWAAWDPVNYAFRMSLLDVIADDLIDSGIWSDTTLLLWGGPGASDGEVVGESVVGVRPTQVHFPEAGIFADTTNPISAWRATWRTSDLRLRSVPLVTMSSEYWLYTDEFGVSDNFIETLQEGAAAIQVVPAPMTGLVFLAALAGAPRRPRRI